MAFFLRYLTANRFNAVMTQMLDMVSEAPLRRGDLVRNVNLKRDYTHYELANIVKLPYDHSRVPDPKLRMHVGGIRKRIFSTNNGLTKLSLLLMDGKLRPFIVWHHARSARIADVSCVLLHYPFVTGFYEKVQDAVKTGRYGFLMTDEYQLYWKKMQAERVLPLITGTCQRLNDVDELVESGFLVVSDRYADWVRSDAASSIRTQHRTDVVEHLQ